MSTLPVTLEPITRERVAPGDAAVEATIVNEGDRPEPFHEHQARHGSLVLQVEDPSGRRLLLPPPPTPGRPEMVVVAPGGRSSVPFRAFVPSSALPGCY